MKYTIRKGGEPLYTTYVNDGIYHEELMTSEYVELDFVTDHALNLQIGDTVSVRNVTYTIMKVADPTRDSKGGLHYKQQFVADWMLWANRKLFFNRGKSSEAGWKMTQTPDYFLQLICDTLDYEGFGVWGYEITDSNLTDMKLCDFTTSQDIISALNTMCDNEHWATEWRISKAKAEWKQGDKRADGQPYVGKIMFGLANVQPTSVQTITDDTFAITRSEGQNANTATRLYVFGSTRNLTPYYRKHLVFTYNRLSEEDEKAADKWYYDYNKKHVGHKVDMGWYLYDKNRVIYDEHIEDKYKQKFPIGKALETAIDEEVFGGSIITDSCVHDATETIVANLNGTLTLSGIYQSSEWQYKITVRLEYDSKTIHERVVYINSTDVDEGEEQHTWALISLLGEEWGKIDYIHHADKPTLNKPITMTTEIAEVKGHCYGTFACYVGITLSRISDIAQVPVTIYYKTPRQSGDYVYDSKSFMARTGATKNENALLSRMLIVNAIDFWAPDEGDTYVIEGLKPQCLPSSAYTPIDETDGGVRAGVAENRLRLPTGIPYLDYKEFTDKAQIKEDVLVLDEIYPRVDTVVTDVQTYEARNTDEESGVVTYWNAFRIRYNGIDFRKEYVISGQTLHIVFQTGVLAGMDFDIAFNPLGLDESAADSQMFEIVRNDSYGMLLPTDTFCPQVGDKFNLYGYSLDRLTDSMVKDAEAELQIAGQEALATMHEDASTYECVANIPAQRWGTNHFKVGDKVVLKSELFGQHVSRVRMREYRLDLGTFKVSVGKHPRYSKYKALQSLIKN